MITEKEIDNKAKLFKEKARKNVDKMRSTLKMCMDEIWNEIDMMERAVVNLKMDDERETDAPTGK